MGPPPHPSTGTATLVGREGALASIDAALMAGRPACVVLKGPPGSGVSALLEYAAARAAERGLRVERWSPGRHVLPHQEPGTPLLVCVEEAQGLDAAAASGMPTGVVVAAIRSGMPVADPRWLAALTDGAAVVTLAPLTAEQADVRFGAALGAELVTEATAVTGGNARLLARLAEHLEMQRDGPRAPEDRVADLLPEIAGYWAAQLGRMGPDCQALAESLAVLGDETALWVAAELAGLGRPRAAQAVDALVAAGLLAAADPVRVGQPIAVRALYAAIGAARRNAAHLRAAGILGRAPEGATAAAEHLLAIPPTGQSWPAVLLSDAARVAGEAGEGATAVAYLRRALAEPVEPPLRRRLLIELGAAHDREGTVGAEAAYRQALRLTAIAERPRIHLLLGRALYGAGSYRAAGLELERGLEALGDSDDELAIELVAAYVAAARFDRTLEDAAARHLTPAMKRAAPGRTPAERALLAEIALEQGIRGAERATVVSLAQRAWADGLLLDETDAHGIAVSGVAAALTWSDAFVASDAMLSATLERAQADGEALVAATARYLRAWPRWYLGRLDEAEEDARAALESPSWHMYEPSARAVLGHVLLDRGDHEGAWQALVMRDAAPWERTVPFAMLLETRARLHVAAGRLVDATADLEQAGALLDTMGNQSPFCPWRSRLGVVTAARGELERGRALAAEELAQAERIGLPRARGVALQAAALIAQLAGEDPTELYARACQSLAESGARVEHARALTGLGEALAGAGRRTEARTPLRDALELATAIGAAELAARAERALRKAGGRPTAGSANAPGALTASERQVARMAARGLTNAAIARDLVVTVHAVRFHLGRVYRKLGVSSRQELGARLSAETARRSISAGSEDR